MISKVIKKHGLVEHFVILSACVQVPMWISMAVGIRELSNGVDFSYPGITLALTQGGTLWFDNLMQPDPYHILPILFPLMIWFRFEV